MEQALNREWERYQVALVTGTADEMRASIRRIAALERVRDARRAVVRELESVR